MGRMQAIGMAWTYLGKYRSVDDELKAFEAVNVKKIAQVLDRYPLGELTILFAPGRMNLEKCPM